MIQPRPSLRFQSLPLMEVVVRLYFRASTTLTFADIYRLREQLDGFVEILPLRELEASPVVRDVSPIPDAAGLLGAEFVGHPAGWSVKLQTQLLAIRWRRTTRGLKYPGYAQTKSLVKHAFELTQSHFGANASVAVANMAYSNFVIAEDIREYLADSFCAIRGIQTPRVFEITAGWSESDGTDLRYQVQHAIQKAEPAEGYLLTTTCGRRADSLELEELLDQNHGKLQGLFDALITSRAKKEWGLDE